jgi:hypothetical protein
MEGSTAIGIDVNVFQENQMCTLKYTNYNPAVTGKSDQNIKTPMTSRHPSMNPSLNQYHPPRPWNQPAEQY